MPTRCELCPNTNPFVPPDGPYDSPYLFVGEAPGKQESSGGKPFIGKTGDEVNRHYLPLAGLRREAVRLDNSIHCLPPGPKGKLDPHRPRDLALLQSCAECHLYPELERLKPKLIIPMGQFACRAIDPSIDLELQHGFPVETRFGTAFPMYHPAGGIHSPKSMIYIRTDWTRLRKYLLGKLRVPMDEFAGMEDYRWLQTMADVDDVLMDRWHLDMAIDTEVMRGGAPYCLTFSPEPGCGYLIRAEDRELLDRFQLHLHRWRGKIVFHNWLFDQEILHRMKLCIPFKRVEDTMIRAYHLGNLPQGLKALAYRELGMKMQDFDDLVTPHSRELVLEYYRQIRAEDWPKPEQSLLRDGETWKVKTPMGMNAKIKRFWTDYSKSPETKDPFSTWANWEEHHQMIEDTLGPWPGRCVSHVPFDEVIAYACRDTSATIRLWQHLKRIKPRVRKGPQEHWAEV